MRNKLDRRNRGSPMTAAGELISSNIVPNTTETRPFAHQKELGHAIGWLCKNVRPSGSSPAPTASHIIGGSRRSVAGGSTEPVDARFVACSPGLHSVACQDMQLKLHHFLSFRRRVTPKEQTQNVNARCVALAGFLCPMLVLNLPGNQR